MIGTFSPLFDALLHYCSLLACFFFFAVLPIAEVEQEKVDVLQRLFRGWFEMDGLLDVRF